MTALALTALCGLAACDRGGAAPAEAAEAAAADRVIASVLPLTRDSGGVRVAMDSLQALVARDDGLRKRGHHLAHSLGRLAVAERRSLSVLGECTPVFQSGCFHGAMEGFFLNGGTAGPASVHGICPQRPGPGQPGYEVLECWHGLGHGLMVQSRGDIRQALPLCDALQSPAWRRECQDGVFMERAVRAAAPAPAAAADGDAHGAHGDPAPSAAPLSTAQLQQLCSGVDVRYQPSCWLYQPAILVGVHGLDPGPVLRACDGAPAAAVRECYRGYGKTFLAARSGDTRGMIRACRGGDRARATDCLLGGVEYFTDLAWTAEPGIAFCRQLSTDAKPACYEMIGARLALIHPDPQPAAAACRTVERGLVEACLAGLRRGREAV
ncbi:MAG TPA: hypothetical protein VEQ60_07550 [Longimicrobium sp.]|nr:hypothetical protein [Longimicrobium sp.]